MPQPCEALHGDIPQAQREKTLGRFRAGDIQVLVATDVASRGLDIPNVDLVVHYDLPQVGQDYGRHMRRRFALFCTQRSAGMLILLCGASKGLLAWHASP